MVLRTDKFRPSLNQATLVAASALIAPPAMVRLLVSTAGLRRASPNKAPRHRRDVAAAAACLPSTGEERAVAARFSTDRRTGNPCAVP
jgi:hypothetical protein